MILPGSSLSAPESSSSNMPLEHHACNPGGRLTLHTPFHYTLAREADGSLQPLPQRHAWTREWAWKAGGRAARQALHLRHRPLFTAARRIHRVNASSLPEATLTCGPQGSPLLSPLLRTQEYSRPQETVSSRECEAPVLVYSLILLLTLCSVVAAHVLSVACGILVPQSG